MSKGFAVSYKMRPVADILKRLGMDKDGDVQKQLTNIVNRRMTRYMPASTQAVLSTKKKHIISQTEIQVDGPYARVHYRGKVMVNAKTGKGPALIPGVGYRYKEGTILKATDRDMNYDTSNNPKAGPNWDERLVDAEGDAIVADLQKYVDGRGK